MRKIFLAYLMACSSWVFAGALPQMNGLPDGTIGLAAAEGKLISVEPLCPKDENINCVTNGTVVTLQFTGGCLDNLIPLTYQSSEDRREVFVHALIALNEQSRVTMCKPPLFEAKIALINQYPPFKMHFMGLGKSVEIH